MLRLVSVSELCQFHIIILECTEVRQIMKAGLVAAFTSLILVAWVIKNTSLCYVLCMRGNIL